MKENELKKITGGVSWNGTLISALVKGIESVMGVGQSLGSAIRMYITKTSCSI